MSNEKSIHPVVTRVEGEELIIERVFKAPRMLVFKMFSESEHVEQWWGPKGWKTENRRFEFKPGGVWHYCMRCYDKELGDFYGQSSWSKGVYTEIVVPESIIYINSFVDENEVELEGMPKFQVTMQFDECEERTKLIMRTRFASEEARKQVMDMGIVEGVSLQYERLDAWLEQQQ